MKLIFFGLSITLVSCYSEKVTQKKLSRKKRFIPITDPGKMKTNWWISDSTPGKCKIFEFNVDK